MRRSHILRFADGAIASASTYTAEAEAIRASRRIAKRTGRTVEVWWRDDAGTPKAVVHRAEG